MIDIPLDTLLSSPRQSNNKHIDDSESESVDGHDNDNGNDGNDGNDAAARVKLLQSHGHDTPVVSSSLLPPFSAEHNTMLWRAARELFLGMRIKLFKTFVSLCQEEGKGNDNNDNEDTWDAIPSPNEDHETLQLHTRRETNKETGEDTSYCLWRVRGRVECPGEHVLKLLSDHNVKTRTHWDESVKNVKVIDTFPDNDMCVVQTLYKDAPKLVQQAGGTLAIHWSRYNAVNRTWTVLIQAIDQYYKIGPTSPRTTTTMATTSQASSASTRHGGACDHANTWLAVHIRDNHTDAGACYIDLIYRVWSPPLSAWKRLLSFQRQYSHAETIRQRIHLFERIQKRWFYYFPPPLPYT